MIAHDCDVDCIATVMEYIVQCRSKIELIVSQCIGEYAEETKLRSVCFGQMDARYICT